MTVLDNQQAKARPIAVALHRRGMTVEDLLRLPYASRDRSAPTMRSFARTAYLEAGVELPEPHSPVSMTWVLAARLLTWMQGRPDDDRTPGQDLLDDAARWTPPAGSAPVAAAPPSLSVLARCRRCHGPMPADLARLERWTHHPCCDPVHHADLAWWGLRLAAEARRRRLRRTA